VPFWKKYKIILKKEMGKSRDKIQESFHDTDKNNIKGKEFSSDSTKQAVWGEFFCAKGSLRNKVI
jgi:hypothetical protein